MKVGDKVWVEATVLELSQNSVLVRGCADKYWWVRDIDCKPVVPESINQDQAFQDKCGSSKELLKDSDTIEPGDFFETTRDGKYHLCNFTVGMKVSDAILRGRKLREDWTFYRKKPD
jgi:hypothetical protein